jgi:hypothetical protein
MDVEEVDDEGREDVCRGERGEKRESRDSKASR